MIKTIIGLVLLILPFLLLTRFENKKLGFVYILSFVLGFHLFVALITQALGIFNYSVIIGINLIAVLVVFKFVNFKKLNIKKIKIDWILIIILIILFIQLFSIHYNYTGEATVFKDGRRTYEKVENMKYPYPYFSDEWSGVSLIQYSIDSGKLPLVNPLWHNEEFPNFELPFHSFTSEIVLLLGLNPLLYFTLLTIFSGILICILVYLILVMSGLGKMISGVACLSVPYIVNGANLPGIWNLMPLTIGIISLLLSFIFILKKKFKISLYAGFLTLIFYPPLFVLYIVSFIFSMIFSKLNKKKKIKFILGFLIICFLVVILLSLFAFFVVDNFFDYVFIKIFYETFTKGAIPDFSILKIIPVLSLLLGGFGIFEIIRREEAKNKLWLITPMIIGLIYWWIYTFSLWRFIIEYERVVMTTSILIIILSGFGLYYLIDYLKKIEFIKKYKIIEIVLVLVFVLFFIGAFSYTQRDNWKNLKLERFNGEKVSPAAPANKYLSQEDLRLFKGIKGKNFLSVPWKGLVIAVSTKNYALETKESTITSQVLSYNEFMDMDCEDKKETARNEEIDYVYSHEFDCKGFELKGKSKEGFFFYEVK